MEQNGKVRGVTDLLEREYRSPRHYNKRNPLNEFLFIILSLRTDERVYNKVYRSFKHRYPRWSQVYSETTADIASNIYSGGLSLQKAERIESTLGKLMLDFGDLSLKYIRPYGNEQMEKYLLTLPGVGLKTARCIMMYSFGREVLPVDTHTYRVSQRLGFVEGELTEDKAHRGLDKIIPPSLRYSYHVNCVAHGRAVCKFNNPNCQLCIINSFCDYHVQNKKDNTLSILRKRKR